MTQPPFIGRYRIESELGRGGMGVVYRAIDPELDRAVAIKLILLPPDASAHVREELDVRFRREAKAAARIRHPGVVAIHDVGSTSTGLFLVMELVEGESLARRLERGAFPGRAQALDLAARAAEALGAAHRAGVVHRDVKPANILLSSDGRVLLTDFGVARSLDEVSELTRTGMVVGSPAYMAPEQLQGATVDGRADLFSLGVVLYELLLRKRPFPAQSITTLLYQILHEDPLADPSLVRELDPATAGVLRRLLAKQPAERFADAAAVAAELRRLPRELAAPALATVDLEGPTQQHALHAVPRAAPPPPPAAGPPAAWTHAPGPATPTPAPLLAASTDPGTGAAHASPGRGGVPAVLWVALGAILLGVVAVGGVVAWWQIAPSRPSLERGGPAVGWDPSAAGALPEPSYAVTGTPVPVTSAIAQAPTPPLPTPAAAVPAAAPPPPEPRVAQPERQQPAREPEPPPAVREEPPPAPETPPERPAPDPEPIIAEEHRYVCRQGMEIDVDPEEAEIFVNGRSIGTSARWDGEYVFEAPGRYLVRFVHPGYRSTTVEVVVTPSVRRKWAEVEVELEEIE